MAFNAKQYTTRWVIGIIIGILVIFGVRSVAAPISVAGSWSGTATPLDIENAVPSQFKLQSISSLKPTPFEWDLKETPTGTVTGTVHDGGTTGQVVGFQVGNIVQLSSSLGGYPIYFDGYIHGKKWNGHFALRPSPNSGHAYEILRGLFSFTPSTLS
ncbi:MAG: hypothetical protein OWS74_02450 [Firmicutes bacterium]|nr:hypothetical protein [Bacillota bacterium]